VACAAGPGLAFIAYPEGIAMMPLAPFWSALFFVMLFTLGVDSQFGLLETGVTALVDEFAVLRRGRRKVGVVAAVCVALFVLGLPQCSPVSRRRSVVCLSVCVRSLTSSPRPTQGRRRRRGLRRVVRPRSAAVLAGQSATIHASTPDTTTQSSLCRRVRCAGANWTVAVSVFRL